MIEYYKTGSLETWDAYNIAWASATEGDIDYINSFIEVYNDPLGYRGSYETIVEINDFEASERMKVLADNAQQYVQAHYSANRMASEYFDLFKQITEN